MIILEALWGSTVLRTLSAIFLGLGAFWGYGQVKEYVGEAKGKAEVVSQVKAKAAKDAGTAASVRAAVDAGKGKASYPYLRGAE